MTVTGHVPEGMDLERGVESGMDQVNHIPYVTKSMRPSEPAKSSKKSNPFDLAAMAGAIDLDSDGARQTIRLLKEHGTVIDPTLVIYELSLHAAGRVPEPGLAKVAPELAGPLGSMGVPAEMEKATDALFRKYVQAVGILHRAGVPIVAGTDQSVPGHSLHRELELYVQAGMTPMEAIQSATIVPARDEARPSGRYDRGRQAGRPHPRRRPARSPDLRHPQGTDRDRGRASVRLCGALEERWVPALNVRIPGPSASFPEIAMDAGRPHWKGGLRDEPIPRTQPTTMVADREPPHRDGLRAHRRPGPGLARTRHP